MESVPQVWVRKPSCSEWFSLQFTATSQVASTTWASWFSLIKHSDWATLLVRGLDRMLLDTFSHVLELWFRFWDYSMTLQQKAFYTVSGRHGVKPVSLLQEGVGLEINWLIKGLWIVTWIGYSKISFIFIHSSLLFQDLFFCCDWEFWAIICVSPWLRTFGKSEASTHADSDPSKGLVLLVSNSFTLTAHHDWNIHAVSLGY